MGIWFITGLTAEAAMAAAIAASPGQVIAGGGTPAGAARAAARAIAAGATGLVSFGVAGGLAPGLRAGDLIVPGTVRAGSTLFPVDAALAAWLGGGDGLLCDAPAIVATRAGKAALHRATGAVAIDLETGEVARAASLAGIPFAALRAIVDTADQDLPPAALTALDAAGRISPWRLAASLVRHPGQIPGLIRLGRNAAAARAALRGRVARLAAARPG